MGVLKYRFSVKSLACHESDNQACKTHSHILSRGTQSPILRCLLKISFSQRDYSGSTDGDLIDFLYSLYLPFVPDITLSKIFFTAGATLCFMTLPSFVAPTLPPSTIELNPSPTMPVAAAALTDNFL